MKLNKTIDDYRAYLKIIQKLAAKLSPEQQDQLEEILRGQLTLLIALKKSSNLGEFGINFI